VVIDVENEDPEVEWIPAPNYVAVVIANEDATATPLLQDDIAAINVAPEFDVSACLRTRASLFTLQGDI